VAYRWGKYLLVCDRDRAAWACFVAIGVGERRFVSVEFVEVLWGMVQHSVELLNELAPDLHEATSLHG